MRSARNSAGFVKTRRAVRRVARAFPWCRSALARRIHDAACRQRPQSPRRDILHLASSDSSGLLAQAFAGFCQRHARTHFAARVNHWSARMALVPQRLALSSARSRWGSCSAAGGVRLNWRLMQAPLVIDYVVIHELAHLAELNHSPFLGDRRRALPGLESPARLAEAARQPAARLVSCTCTALQRSVQSVPASAA